MEDENSSKAVTLLSCAQAVDSPHPTTLPPKPQFAEPYTADASATSPSSVTAKALRRSAPFAEIRNAAAANKACCESDSNEETLIQQPQVSLPRSLASQSTLAWAGVSATPPSALFGMPVNNNGGGGGLFPASVLHAESACTPIGQSISIGCDFSHRGPLTSTTKPPQRGGCGANTYKDSGNSESISNASLGAVGRAASLHLNKKSGGGGKAQRSLFRSVATTGLVMPTSPLVGAPSQWGPLAASATPTTPALCGGDSVLVMEPPTPAKQRRTIHATVPTAAPSEVYLYGKSGHDSGGVSQDVSCGPRLSAAAPTSAADSLHPCMSPGGAATAGGAGATSSPKLLPCPVAPLRLPPSSPSLPRATTPASMMTAANNNSNSNGNGGFPAAPSMIFKFHRHEGSRKRSADVLSQFSALDLDETPATPYGQTVLNGRFNSLGGGGGNGGGSSGVLPSQTPAPGATARGSTAFVPTSPLMGGYATPVTLSQQISGPNTFSQLLLHPSQDVLDMSQADTECSNFLARRILNDYNEVRLLGRGSFGTVSLYKEISSGDYVAVKMSPPLRATDMARRYRRERSIMSMARGMPHVVQLSAAWEEGRVPRMYLQLEYCPGGSLAALASAKQSRGEVWAEEEVKVFLVHMSIALDALHRANIAHVDFKPDNVLVDKDGAYKLSDFGCSVLLDENGRPQAETHNGYNTSLSPGKAQQQQHQLRANTGNDCRGSLAGRRDATATATAAVGTSGTIVTDFNWADATETSAASVDEGDCRYLCADMLNEKKYFKAGDMFSLGMSLYELMSGQPLPRNGDQFLALRRQVPAEQLRRRGYSPALIKLVAALLHSDPTQRPTARQVLQYLRPSQAELQLLADPAAMQQWTASAESFTALQDIQQQQQQQQQQRHESEQSGSDSHPYATVAALRCLSAMMEGSCWLLTTTQQDVHCTLTKAAAAASGVSGDEEAEQQQQQRARQCPPLPPQRYGTGNVAETELDDLPMSPIAREEACTPTTLHY